MAPLSLSEMPFYIHALMQNPNDIERAIRLAIENKMPTNRAFEITLTNIGWTSDLASLGKGLNRRDQVMMILISLLKRPLPECVKPYLFKIRNRQG